MNITQFTMEEVRCFAERQEFNIRPLTFLVGENSTGKTTALACFQVLTDYLTDGEIDFNSAPYSMGIFRDIVRNSRKTEKAFTLGFTFESKNENIECTVEFVERTGGIEPVAKSVIVKFADGEIVLSADDTREVDRLASFDKERNRYCLDVDFAALNVRPPFSLLGSFSHRWEGQSENERALTDYLAKKNENSGISRYPLRDIWHPTSVLSSAPIRSEPKRTYDPTRFFYDPEGGDVPMLLMRMQATDKKRWEALKARLVEFGKRSELFQNIEIKRLGRSLGAPFQLKFKVRGPSSNITDVGYGISQILPILVYILDPDISGNQMNFSLLQQPEIHLHPRAQAQLSSLLVTAASQGGRTFIVETHSDYMIDRARIEIRKGTIPSEFVSLIYLEPKGNVVKVHNISFDKMANMEGVPPHYGEFFLQETNRLMGFGD